MKLFEIVKKYLETNGISIRYFSDCIGVSPNVGGKWLRGDIKKLPAEKMEKIYAFLNEECIWTFIILNSVFSVSVFLCEFCF